MTTTTAKCDTCKSDLRWDEEGQEFLDGTGSAMCSFFEYDDVHQVIEETEEAPTVIDTPDFGRHTAECHNKGWYVLDWASDCLRPDTVTAPLTDAAELAAEVIADRTQDAAS